ncbi:hypothetical protein TIFTF001_038947 [Ficus carica]|uniref:Uncharacterized protein n=1 Tax=Ficus carica TaxID=3494 RepID=A0AA88EBF7_FICCA|nr:hypothetical protein TIFTF001_038938 [Ficus carica]GMN69896.1 hypothetical protein TIFTF001_038941 [Ficus carica]GMN69901.1 hypothetical protein TIFTF001_038944 [Ficus carica]GMN69902.1 hypothetical protein TIFTF001_038947 [Ficus carica]
MGFEGEIGGRSRSGDWRQDREGEARETMKGGVTAEIRGEGEKERREREWREKSRRRKKQRGSGPEKTKAPMTELKDIASPTCSSSGPKIKSKLSPTNGRKKIQRTKSIEERVVAVALSVPSQSSCNPFNTKGP